MCVCVCVCIRINSWRTTLEGVGREDGEGGEEEEEGCDGRGGGSLGGRAYIQHIDTAATHCSNAMHQHTATDTATAHCDTLHVLLVVRVNIIYTLHQRTATTHCNKTLHQHTATDSTLLHAARLAGRACEHYIHTTTTSL